MSSYLQFINKALERYSLNIRCTVACPLIRSYIWQLTLISNLSSIELTKNFKYTSRISHKTQLMRNLFCGKDYWCLGRPSCQVTWFSFQAGDQYQLSDSSVSGCGISRKLHSQWAPVPGEQGHKGATPINAFIQLSIPPTDGAKEHLL